MESSIKNMVMDTISIIGMFFVASFLHFDAIIDYNCCPVLSSDKLDLRIPHFDWHGGHSGRLLDEQSTTFLEKLWQEHVDNLLNDPNFRSNMYVERR